MVKLAHNLSKPTDIEIDLDELVNYCKIRGIKNDGKARSQFVQAK